MSNHIKVFKLFPLILLTCLICSPWMTESQESQHKYDKGKDAYNYPVRPGIPGKTPFWNTYSKRFMYAPAFDFNEIEKAVFYRFTAISLASNEEFSFDAETPSASLAPIWEKLPVGQVALICEGHDDRGQIFGLAGTRVFYRAAGYNGPYLKQEKDYGESARQALKFLFDLKPIQTWLEARLDTSYFLYCYPSKIIGAVVESMLLYADVASDNDGQKAINIAKNAADFLMGISEPEGKPYACFPPTYYKDYQTLSRGMFTRAKEFQGQLMMTYPASVAGIYLSLFDATKDQKYFEAAVKIANTYLKTQLPSGTWHLKVWMDTGEPVNKNVCLPTSQIVLFDRFEKQYQISNYMAARDRAFQWIMDNPVKTFNWEGQFEDIPPVEEYANLSGSWAIDFASYLFEHSARQKDIVLAEEILRYVEDQFVVWEQPLPKKEYLTETWCNPCVLEQYRYYTPVGAAATRVMLAYQKAYVATGKEMYLDKAKDFANNLTKIQNAQTGQYYTWWDTNPKHQIIGWFNCATEDIKAILEFNAFMKTMN